MSDIKIKKPVTVKGVIYLVAFAIIVSGIIYGVSLPFGQVGMAVRLTGIFLVFVAVLSYLLMKNRRMPETPNQIVITGIDTEVVQEDEEGKTRRWHAKHFDTYPRNVDLIQYVNSKNNHNIAIIGMAGSGKTELTYKIIQSMEDYHKVIFQYKNSDRYKELGYPVLLVKKYAPNVFRNKEAFTQAWLTAFFIENRGITASQIEPLVRSLAERSENWEEFRDEAEKRAKKEAGTITGNALADIILKIGSVASDKQYNSKLPDDIVLDYEKCNEDEFVFYAEYVLRELYEEVKAGTRAGTMIFVDEAHKFTKSANTIIPELSAIIRSRGAFLFATQRESTISGDVKGNAGCQFCFLQTEAEDLRDIEAISPLLGFAMKELKEYEFVDLAQRNINRGVYHFYLNKPTPTFYPIKEWKPEVEVVEIDYEAEIMKVLEKAMNIQGIARRIAEEHRLDRDRVKRDIIPVLKRMIVAGEINSIEVENAKFINKKMTPVRERVYFVPKTEQLHDYLVKAVADILTMKEGKFKIEPHGVSTPDITSDDFVVEVETGLKRKFADLQARLERYKKDGRMVFLIVPNAETKKSYPNSMTVQEFSLWIGEAEEYGTVKEGEKVE